MNEKNIFKIKISTAGGGKPFIKQLPSLNPVWGNCEFYINEDIDECDLWVVYGGLEKEEGTKVAKENIVLITTEPESVHKYNHQFTKQFGAIVTCQKGIKHPNIIHQQQALPWWIGYKMQSGEDKYYKTYDELKALPTPIKTKLASIIVSNKTFTKGHKKRHDFLNKLKNELGDQIDIYGLGSNTLDDKWDGIAPYKYHIVLENSSTNDYWTEKLTDTFLAGAYPIYYGCTNIYDYFTKDTLSVIDIDNTDEAINTIKYIIQSDLYERSEGELKIAKNLILDKYQIFPMLCEYINDHKNNLDKVEVTLYPEKTKFVYKILNKFKKIIHG